MNGDDIGKMIIVAVFICLVVFGFKFAAADGKFDYCYIAADNRREQTFYLREHVPWREDRYLMPVASIDEAKEQAAKLGCEIH